MRFIKGMNTSRAFLLGLLTFAVVMLSAASAFSGPSSQRVRPVKTVQVREKKQVETRAVPGIARSAREVKLSFRVGGPVVSFDCRIGQTVEKGQVLARIDPRDFRVKIDQLKAGLREADARLSAMKKGARPADIRILQSELEAAQAVYKEAEQNFTRTARLYRENVVPESYYEKAQSGFERARAKLKAAAEALSKARKGARTEDIQAMESKIEGLEARLTEAENARQDTLLTAPFKGVVNRKFNEVHETVAPGQPVLTLLDFSAREVAASITEQMLRSLDQVKTIQCTFNTLPELSFNAAIKEIGKKTDAASQSYPVTLVVRAPENAGIYPGMAAVVTFTFPSPDEEQGFMVPADAVFADKQGRSCLWVVDEETMTVKKRRIEGVRLSGDHAVVKDGIRKGDRIVSAGAAFLDEGQKIKLLNR